MFIVETYADPHQLLEEISFRDDELHVTAQTVFAGRLIQLQQEQGTRAWIDTFDNVMHRLYPMWHDGLFDAYLVTRIRQLLKELPMSDEMRNSLEHSMEEWVKAFRFLVEIRVAGLSETPELTEEQRVFREIFSRLLMDRHVQRAVKEREAAAPFQCVRKWRRPRAVYVYNMLHLNTPRMLMFHQFRSERIPVIFRIPFDSRVEGVYAPWTRVYRQVLKGIPGAEWREKAGTCDLLKGSRWLEHLMGGEVSGKQDPLNIRFLEFHSPEAFRRYAVMHPPGQEKRRYVASSYEQVSRILEGTVDRLDEDGIRHHPAMRFLYHLYDFRLKEDEIFLEYRTLVECFGSGWIQTRGISGVQALPLLIELEPYLSGVRTLSELKQRLNRLEELREAGSEFASLSADKASGNIYKKALTNPFRVFPYAHPDQVNVTVRQLRDLVDDLEGKIRRLLPPEGQTMSVKRHLQNLYGFWRQVREQEGLDPEVVQSMNKSLLHPVDSSWQAERRDLRKIMIVLTSRHMKKNSWLSVDGIMQLEGEVLAAEELHLTDLSLQGLLKHERSMQTLPRPLSFVWIRDAAQTAWDKTSLRYQVIIHSLKVHYEIEQALPSYFDFQLYFMLRHARGDITISWIRGLHEHDEASSKLKLLCRLYGQGERPSVWMPEMELDMLGKEAEEAQKDQAMPFEAAQGLFGEIPHAYWLNYDFCARKFFYTSLVELEPVYESDFHQQIAFGFIGALLAQQADGMDGVREFLFPLFPQWTQTKKENLVHLARNHKLRTYKQFQNINYPAAMKMLVKLLSRYEVTKRYKVKNAYDQSVIRREAEEKWLKEWLQKVTDREVQAEPGDHCKMCPYLSQCPEGELSIERGA